MEEHPMRRALTTERAFSRAPQEWALRACARAALGALLLLATGCASIAEFRQLEAEVWQLEKNGGGGSAQSTGQVADLTLQIDALQEDIARLEGRLEVAEHKAEQALEEAKAARLASAAPEAPAATTVVETPANTQASPVASPSNPPANGAAPAGIAEEVQDYRRAYAAWRDGDTQICIDRFREFLQNHPSSAYADDAAYWIADCYFKQGDYKTAILRFDDVAARNPKGKKAADALYREGEALLQMGPRYNEAASKAFERVVKEYPDSARVPDAKRHLEILAAG